MTGSDALLSTENESTTKGERTVAMYKCSVKTFVSRTWLAAEATKPYAAIKVKNYGTPGTHGMGGRPTDGEG